MLDPQEIDSRRLVFAECGTLSDEQARGWRALPVSNDDELPLREEGVVAFCAECAAREFDGD